MRWVVVALLLTANVQHGKASWYGHPYHGRRTAECWQQLRDNPALKDCERYDMHAMTAAHKTLPFGTMVTVCRTNNKCVTVRINDRGPYVKGRVIDLSFAAAKELDMVREGVVPVTLTW